jgi:hypothetical protein
MIGKVRSTSQPLMQLLLRATDRKCAGLITELGAWGPWINGGGWLRLDGQSVDLLFRETSKIEAALDDAILGQIEIAYQPGHPFGFLSSIYVGEVALCLPLWEPNHWVAKAKEKIDGYPERLRRTGPTLCF